MWPLKRQKIAAFFPSRLLKKEDSGFIYQHIKVEKTYCVFCQWRAKKENKQQIGKQGEKQRLKVGFVWFGLNVKKELTSRF